MVNLESLYELAVTGLLTQGCSVEEYNTLPSGIKELLLPKIIEKLQKYEQV